MAFDENLADRIRFELKNKNIFFNEKKMMGGLTFMVDEKMCIGIIKNELMLRIDPELYEEMLNKQGCKEMNFTGKAMKGFIMIEPMAIDMDEDLSQWMQLALDYNPFAKSSKKK